MGSSLASAIQTENLPNGSATDLGEFGEALWAKKVALDDAVRKAAQWISTARAVLVGAGAGMGVDSGLGTYRGAAMGVWPPLEALGIDYREICTPDALVEHPQLAWAFWRYCMIAYRNAEPHEGYGIIQQWAARARLGVFCYTTNVDAMWPRILQEGCLYEAHGSTSFLQCSNARGGCPGKGMVWPCPDNFAEQLSLEASRDDSVELGALPHCPDCGNLARPNVNLFGDLDFSKKRSRIQREAYRQWLQSVDGDIADELAPVLEQEQLAIEANERRTEPMDQPMSDELLEFRRQAESELLRRPVVCLEIGAGISIPTVRTALETRAAQAGHVLIRINPENCDIPAELQANGRAVSLPLSAVDALRRIADCTQGMR